MRGRLSAACACSIALFSRPLLAEAPEAPPRPETLPSLSSRDAQITAETTFASVGVSEVERSGGITRARQSLRIEQLAVEVPLSGRRWFVGGTYTLVAGTRPTGGVVALAGAPAVHVRGAWVHASGLAFGGGFASFVPFGAWGRSDATLALASSAASVRGWDRAAFDPYTFTSRAFVDMHDWVGRVLVQYRQALEVAVDTRDASRTTMAAVGTLHLGVRLSPLVSTGVQVVEYYSLEPDVLDASRAHWSISGHIGLATRWFRPMFALATNLGSPLRAISSIGAPLSASPESFVAARVALQFVLDRPQDDEP